MASIRTTITLDDDLADQARRLNVNVSAAARDGVAAAVKAALIATDRDAYRRKPEQIDPIWDEVEAWGQQ
jgi:post-segregation antitoxin (ccd killing protein)